MADAATDPMIPQVTVQIWGSLTTVTGGQSEVTVRARNLRELLTALGTAFPAMQPQLERGVSVSIDGRIFNESWFEPIRPDSEVVLLPKIVGG